MSMIKLIADVRSGVAQISLEKNGQTLGNGSAFLVPGGLVTNSHVIRPPGQFDAIIIRFEEAEQPIRVLSETLYQATVIESPEAESDYAFIRLSEPEFEGRYRFNFGDLSEISVGEQILFLGFPFGMPQLTAHTGYISSIHKQNGRDVIQVDGSVNGGNSGGPLMKIESGMVAGIITRAVTGIIEQEFNNLIGALQNNQKVLTQTQTIMRVGGVDPIEGLKVSQAAMEQIAWHLKRSANVGIGYAFSTNQIRDRVQNLNLA